MKNLNARDYSTKPATAGPKTDKYKGLTGAQIYHEMMREHGVKHIFGYPGGAILPVVDAIHESPHFKFILTRHEQGAGHMAEGYARASGEVGVVLSSTPNESETSTLATFNSLSNAVAACAARSSDCTRLFEATAPPGGAPSSGVLQAVANIAKYPAYPP